VIDPPVHRVFRFFSARKACSCYSADGPWLKNRSRGVLAPRTQQWGEQHHFISRLGWFGCRTRMSTIRSPIFAQPPWDHAPAVNAG